MKKEYFSILETLKESDHSKKHPNDRILLIDGLNTFIRVFSVFPSTNENGIHVGGFVGLLRSIGYAIRMLAPTRVVIVFDGKGGSTRRRKFYPEYNDPTSVVDIFPVPKNPVTFWILLIK